MRYSEKMLWGIFVFIIFLATIQIVGMVWGIELDETYPLFKVLFLGAPILLVILHALVTLKMRGIFFLTLAAVTGFTSEYFGLKYGQFFGAYYTYSPQMSVLTVPLQVIFYWAAFIYTGYCITNSFLLWLHIKKPIAHLGNGKTLIVSIIFDGLFVLAIDLFMDPLEVRQGAWTWINGGPYFGVPIGNFIGWFVVAVIASGIFRSIEYFFPHQNMKFDKSILIIPVILYGFVALSLMGMALRYRMYELGIIGTLLMVPTVVLNLILFNVFRKKK